MRNTFSETRIWLKDRNAINSFVDFKGLFSSSGRGKTILKITCDGAFSLTINGVLAGFGECADFPDRKEYRTFDITKLCKKENEIVFTVWHYGDDSQTYINAPAFLAFRIEENGEPILRSGKHILARKNPFFDDGFCRKITVQLGFSYRFDTTATEVGFVPAEEFGTVQACDGKIKNLSLLKRVPSKPTKSADSVIFDMGKETVGFLDLDIRSPIEQTMTVAYGEHLRDGHAPRVIGERDFSVEVVLSEGENSLLIPFRRLAGRYLEVFAKKFDVSDIRYIGLRPTEYPLRRRSRSFSSALDQRIYDVSVRTLKCCMHEHYEDCPWREQALYTMDSRNQMLCGYEAFYGTSFQRHSLVLIAHSLRKDGLLSICAPSGRDIPIPFFSLVYPIQVAEYVKNTGDRSILKEVSDTLHVIMRTFKERVDDSGLIPNFPYPCWNFYEWSDGNDSVEELFRKETDECETRRDLILNCAFVLAAKYYDELFGTRTEIANIVDSAKKRFYNKKKGVFRSSDKGEKYSQLGNAFALLAGIGDDSLAEKLVIAEDMTPITLSMTTFLYDALLSVDESGYKSFVVSDIRRRYEKMLDAGATTFWETEKGAEDFDGAGSLCHGWSAMPIYYFNKLNIR